ncbi:hypothetical protein CTI12_AA605980 [Artemisia annua]|uniref:Uncharacterized protein n=1 Tax=Artemisia annua TaxID=35608 RepID=A0A2U1KGP2_ARTAN|nr:hypothetical protein CTI12_AA605980 [Artemisia annua]
MEGVDADWFENTNWHKSITNNTATNKDDILFNIKPHNDALDDWNDFVTLIYQNTCHKPTTNKDDTLIYQKSIANVDGKFIGELSEMGKVLMGNEC